MSSNKLFRRDKALGKSDNCGALYESELGKCTLMNRKYPVQTPVTVYIVPLKIMSPLKIMFPRTKFPSEICPPRKTFTRVNCPLFSEKCPPFLAVMCSIQSILVKNLKGLRTDSLKSLIEQSIWHCLGIWQTYFA